MGIYIDEDAKGYPEHYAEQGPKFGRTNWFMDNTTLDLEVFNINFESLKEQKKVLLMLLDNGPFCAIAVAYSSEEFEAFKQTFFSNSDRRVKCPGIIEYTKLIELMPSIVDTMNWEK